MIRKERQCPAIYVGDVTIIPIVETKIEAFQLPRGGLFINGSVRPTAILVLSKDEERRIDLPAQEDGTTGTR